MVQYVRVFFWFVLGGGGGTTVLMLLHGINWLVLELERYFI